MEKILFHLKRPLGRLSEGHLTSAPNLLPQTSTTSQRVCIKGRLSQSKLLKYPNLGYLSPNRRLSRKICLHRNACKAKQCQSTHRVRNPRSRRRPPLLRPVPLQCQNNRSYMVSSLTSIQARHQSPHPRGTAVAVAPRFPQDHHPL